MTPSRELLLHLLTEAAELEHNLMCTYLYAAFSLKSADELPPEHAATVAGWRKTLIEVATEEMAHLANVWNITSALGGTPHFGRLNFPLDPGILPASIVVKLAPFSRAVVQHFVFLERPATSREPEGEGFEPELQFRRGTTRDRITPMAMDYETVGSFYERLEDALRSFHAAHGAEAFIGDPALQLGQSEMPLPGVAPVKCLPTALAALDAIVAQGEGAPEHSENSHFTRFLRVREELAALQAAAPDVQRSHPAATNPVLRPPLRATGRVWIEDEEAAVTVDVANTCYAVMLRLLAYSYALPAGSGEGRRDRARDRADARDDAARRTRRAPARRSVEPALQRGHVVHGAARCRAAAARCAPRAGSSSSGSASSPRSAQKLASHRRPRRARRAHARGARSARRCAAFNAAAKLPVRRMRDRRTGAAPRDRCRRRSSTASRRSRART